MVSLEPVVLFGRVISLVDSWSVGHHPRPDGGGREATVAKEIDGESGGLLEVNRFFCLVSTRTVRL